MARKKLPRIDLTGISTNQLINLDDDTLMDITRSQFRKYNLTQKQYRATIRRAFADITSRLVSTANKRIRQLGKTEIGRMAPAYLSAMKRGKFSVKGKNYNQLRNVFKTTKEFLKYKTSTTEGWKEVRERIEKEIGTMTKWEEKKFWKTYRMLEEVNGGFVDKSHNTRLSSDQIQKMLHQELSDSGWRTKRATIIDSMQKKIEQAYLEESYDEDEEDYFDELEDDELD